MNFASDGTLAGGASTFGDVSGGPLPSTLTFDNGGAFNDYFEGFTFGSMLTFDITLFGPALSTPNGTASSGSAFGFSLFSDPAGTIAALTTDPTGLAFRIDIQLNGTTTATNLSPATTLAAVPEPGTLLLTTTALAGVFASRRRYRSRSLAG